MPVREIEMPVLMGGNFVDTWLAWYRLSALDQLRYPPLENIRWPN